MTTDAIDPATPVTVDAGQITPHRDGVNNLEPISHLQGGISPAS